LAIAAIAGSVGALWQKYQGPQGVMLVNQDTTTRVMVVQDSAQRALMSGMLEELRALRIDARRPALQRQGGTPQPLTSELPFAVVPNPIEVPEVRLPGVVRGYIGRDLGVFAVSSCGATDYRAGADAAIQLTLRSPSDTARLSPIHLTIARRSSPTGGVQLLGQQYRLTPNSLVVFPVPPTPGIYELEFGVFLEQELTTAYPPFYRRECRLKVS
jgi:hypothetical protein